MATNMIDILQQRLGYGPLQKIDPNTQEIKLAPDSGSSMLAQAAIPATLVGIYKRTRSDEDATMLLSGKNSTSWLNFLFDYAEESVVKKVADYASVSTSEASKAMERIASESIIVINEQTAGNTLNGHDVKQYVAGQRNAILTYLPAELQIGNLLNDNTVDDRTNKMEGPVSGMMHSIEKIFSSSD